jgi:hypothetical protein
LICFLEINIKMPHFCIIMHHPSCITVNVPCGVTISILAVMQPVKRPYENRMICGFSWTIVSQATFSLVSYKNYFKIRSLYAIQKLLLAVDFYHVKFGDPWF